MGTAATLAMRLYQDRLGAQGWDIIEPDTDADGTSSDPGDRLGQGEPRRPRPIGHWPRW